jgi:hypothetical protein
MKTIVKIIFMMVSQRVGCQSKSAGEGFTVAAIGGLTAGRAAGLQRIGPVLATTRP